jgi:hypothetical protein
MKRIVWFWCTTGVLFYSLGFWALANSRDAAALYFGIGVVSLLAVLFAMLEMLMDANRKVTELNEVREDAYMALQRMLPVPVQREEPYRSLLHNLAVGHRGQQYGR